MYRHWQHFSLFFYLLGDLSIVTLLHILQVDLMALHLHLTYSLLLLSQQLTKPSTRWPHILSFRLQNKMYRIKIQQIKEVTPI